jgi:hypothetical protein
VLNLQVGIDDADVFSGDAAAPNGGAPLDMFAGRPLTRPSTACSSRCAALLCLELAA